MSPIWCPSTSGRKRIGALSIAVLAVTASACGGHSASHSTETGRPILNRTTAAQLIGSFANAGLAVPNAHDVTPVECPEINCIDAMATDTVTVIKFANTGAAQRFAGATPDMYQIEDIVLVFNQPVPADQKAAYERIARTAV
jgi:hypothetical protein